MYVFTYTIVPEKIPAAHLARTICQIVFLRPNIAAEIDNPARENTSTGLRPKRSAALPHGIIKSIWVKENRDS